MRKFFLVAALVLVSATAHAGPSMQVASNDTPTAQSPEVKPEPAQPEAAKPAKRVAKHEGREAKARRIAARYGVYW